MGHLDPHLIRGTLGTPKSLNKRHLDRLRSFLLGSLVSDRQKDWQTRLLGVWQYAASTYIFSKTTWTIRHHDGGAVASTGPYASHLHPDRDR